MVIKRMSEETSGIGIVFGKITDYIPKIRRAYYKVRLKIIKIM